MPTNPLDKLSKPSCSALCISILIKSTEYRALAMIKAEFWLMLEVSVSCLKSDDWLAVRIRSVFWHGGITTWLNCKQSEESDDLLFVSGPLFWHGRGGHTTWLNRSKVHLENSVTITIDEKNRCHTCGTIMQAKNLACLVRLLIIDLRFNIQFRTHYH